MPGHRGSYYVVETPAGCVLGDRQRGIYCFKGVPYGGPTGGCQRWRPPTQPRPWLGVRDATAYGPAFVQIPTDPVLLAAYGGTAPAQTSEDALVLNVWTSSSAGHGCRPVLVLIHGGGYCCGSGAEFAMYDGTALALRGDVVVVTFNYRLGVLGFLHLDHIAGNVYPASGNTGLLDQIAALQWVHDNIAAFGGDPGNVTIVGSSAGGHAVTTLLATPKAAGLFHRAIAQSPGACFNRTSKQAADVANLVLAKLDIAPDRIDRLATLPADQLVTAFWDAAQSFTGMLAELVGPVVDGVVLPTRSVDAVRDGVSAGIPLLIGNNAAEPECGVDVDQFAQAKASGGHASIFRYLFAWRSTTPDGAAQACHGLELPFALGNVECPATGTSPGRHRLAAQMSTAWIAFARTGDPNHPELPYWPAWSDDGREMMIFDVPSRVVSQVRTAESNEI